MLYKYNCMSVIDKSIKGFKQFVDVVEMKTCCRFVKNKKYMSAPFLLAKKYMFYPLTFTARECA